MTPTHPANQSCPGSPCHTLDHYADQFTEYVAEINISLVFLEGVHDLSYSFTASNFFSSVLEFQGHGAVPGDTVIRLLPSASISLRGMNQMQFSLVNIRVEQSSYFILQPVKRFINIRNVQNVTVKNAEIIGKLLNVQILQNSHTQFTNCKFQNSTLSINFSDILFQDSTFYGTFVQISNSNHTLVQNSTFFECNFGVVAENPEHLSFLNCAFQKNPFSIAILVGSCKYCNIIIQNSTVSGGQIGVGSLLFRNFLEVIHSQGIIQKELLQGNRSVQVLIQRTQFRDTNIGLNLAPVNNVTIIDSLIKDNILGAQCSSTSISIHNTVFTGNKDGLLISPLGSLPFELFRCVKCTFSFNKDSGLEIFSIPADTVLTDCSFYNNQGTPMSLYGSTIELRGETVFRDNTAVRGGGLVLYNSTMIFGSGSNTMFINNTAQEFGGAIYIYTLPIVLIDWVQSRTIVTFTNYILFGWQCFYLTENDAVITFSENKAGLGGLDIYGATLYSEDCSLSNQLFKFDNPILPPNNYQVSSDPTRVCFCINNVPQCENRTYLMLNETRYPGETFTVSVALTGYNFGRVAGSVYVNVQGREYEKVIREGEHVQTVELLECTNISYTVSSSDSVVLVLTAEEKAPEQPDETSATTKFETANTINKLCSNVYGSPCHNTLLTTPVSINVTMELCPLGFELIGDTCDCEKTLKALKIPSSLVRFEITLDTSQEKEQCGWD